MNKHFLVTTAVALTLFLGLGMCFYYSLGRYTPEDEVAYQKLLLMDSDDEQELVSSKQERSELQRDMSFVKNGQRLQFSLKGESADLVLEKHNGTLEIVENMHGVQCWAQENVSEENQSIVFLKAEEASYHYQKELLNAKNVSFFRCILPGKKMEVTGFNTSEGAIDGTAKHAVMFLKEKNWNLEAKEFRGHIHDKEGIVIQADQINYNGSHMNLNGHVRIEYGKDFVAVSDRGSYHSDPSSKSHIIAMSGETPESLCEVTNAAGDLIYSESIQVDTAKKLFLFKQAKGSVNNSEPIVFTANQLVWNDSSQELSLEGDSKISQEGVGELEAANEVFMTTIVIDGKRLVNEVVTRGEAVFTHTDKQTSLGHTLKCYDKVKVDHQKMEVRMYSPKGGDGKVLEGKQVSFSDAKGEIYGDKVFVKYGYVDKQVVPLRVVVQGNVEIINNLASSEGDQQQVKQYILADSVEFFPQTKEMVFKGSKDKRVLLFDKANNLQISAPGFKLIRDKAARKEMIDGLGDVRFNFKDQELDLLQSRFGLDKK